MKQSYKTYLKVVLNLITAVVVLLLCIFLLPRVILFFMPFLIGWLIAWIASPVVRFFEEKLKVRRKAVSAFVIVAVLAAVVLLVYLLVTKLIEEGVNFISELPSISDSIVTEFRQVGVSLQGVYDRLPADIQQTCDNVFMDLETYLSNLVSDVSMPSMEAVGNAAKRIPDIFLAVVISLLSAYFFVADKTYMSDVMKKYVPDSIRYRLDLIRRSFSNAIGGYFRAQLKIECWIYVLLVAGLMILNVRYALLVALGIAFLDFLPVFGTGTVMLPWAVIELLNKNYRMMFGLLIIWLVAQLVRQIIQPKIVGDSVGVDPIPTLFLLYIGYRAAGVVGMILAVPVGMILMNLYEEGMFDTTIQSLQILAAGFNRFRKIRPEDMAIVTEYEKEAEHMYQHEVQQDEKKMEELQEAAQLQIKLEEPLIIKKIIEKTSTKTEKEKENKNGRN
jgi:sporulation integral membrane protein YtvI